MFLADVSLSHQPIDRTQRLAQLPLHILAQVVRDHACRFEQAPVAHRQRHPFALAIPFDHQDSSS